jgi:hypothetical protein
MTMRRISMRAALPVLATLVLAAGAAPAHAGEDGMLVIDATMLYPRDGYAASAGMGAELRILDDDFLTASMGGFAALGQQAEGGNGRDVFDVHFQIGGRVGRRAFSPYAGIGLDVLHVTTHLRGVDHRGTTLGVSVAGGVMGRIGKTFMWRASAGYLGAIVPGTGEDLGGVVFQLGLGAEIAD